MFTGRRVVLGVTGGIAAYKAVEVCPVGVILRKRVGFATPIGARRYDKSPISAQALADAPRPLERNHD